MQKIQEIQITQVIRVSQAISNNIATEWNVFCEESDTMIDD
jgi:hypothetical protein